MMKNILFGLLLLALTGCSGKYLQQCQVDGVEMLSKGVNTMSDKLTASYTKVNQYKLENDKLIQIPNAIKARDTLLHQQKKKLDSLAEDLAQQAIENETYINHLKAGTALATKFCDLLKAISSDEFYKVFTDNKDGLGTCVDSLAGKYNTIAKGKINFAYSGLFSSIAVEIGKSKIRKIQKKYFKDGLSSGGNVIINVLKTFEEIILVNYNADISLLQGEYADNYFNLQERLLDTNIKLEDAQKMIEELQAIKKDFKSLAILGKDINDLSLALRQLIVLLQQSLSEQQDCRAINTLIAKIDFFIQQLENNAQFLK